MTPDALQQTLEDHAAWLRGETHGTRANLARAGLTEANLMGANLARAYLADANLTGADLVGAYLVDADLTDAEIPHR